MNYDSITGLPLEASFLAYAQYSFERQNNNHMYILVISFPILLSVQNSLSEKNKKLLLSSCVDKLIRNHSYMKTAYRDERTDSIIILLDETLMPNHDINEELQKAFLCFSSSIQDQLNDSPVHIHAGIYHLLNQNVPIKEAISLAYSALEEISDKENNTLLAFYHESDKEQQVIEMSIIPAIEDNWKTNNVLIYLQPKFDITTNSMVGAEALVRIMDTKGHMVKPGFFLPILKKHSMTCEMDLIVLEKILRLQSSWNNVGIAPIPISVNLSENSLYNPLFLSIFKELMEKYTDIQRYLRIEISESHYLRNPYHINQMIDFFHSFGCMIELDDFGKNMMSYTQETIPYVDFVKICSAFWSMSMQNDSQEEGFRDCLKLLKNCNIACIGECIENEDELLYVKKHDINVAQGFYFSRPVPFDIFQKKYLSYTFMNV